MAKFSKGIHPQRFWSQVTHDKTKGCWLWQGYTVGKGYGRFMFEGQNMVAHRYAYQQLVEAIPEGMQVCHRCDVPACVNPDHLFLGTNSDNQKDSLVKGRHNTGVVRPEDVQEIKRLHKETGLKATGLARKFGVSKAVVKNILSGHTWTWLEDPR